MSNHEFLVVIERLAQAFPSWKPSADTIEMFAFALSDVPLDSLRAAALAHIRRSKFPPTVAELRELAMVDLGLPSAAEAWAGVREQVRSVGSYGRPKVNHMEARAILACGGWRALCGTETKDMGVVGAHFMRCYDAMAKREDIALQVEGAEKMLQIEPGEHNEPEPSSRLADFLRPALKGLRGAGEAST